MALLPLPSDRLDVWYVRLDEPVPSTLTEHYLSLLTPSELARHARYHFDVNRREYLVTRALIRGALSSYCDVEPRSWRFRLTEHGRPEVSQPVGLPPLSFNVSNTAGLVACVVTLASDVGIDVECVSRGGRLDVAERVFSYEELTLLRALQEPSRSARFFELWTLRESYAKARGLGMALPFDRFWFALRGGMPLLRCDASFDQPTEWQFAVIRPTPVHVLAVAVRRPPGTALVVEIRDVVPLA